MKLSKRKLTVIGIAVVFIVIVVTIVLVKNRDSDVDEAYELTEVPETLKPVDDKTYDNSHDTQVDTDASNVVDTKNFRYDPFSDDSGWGNESIFGSRVIINGTGKADTYSNVVIDSAESSNSSAAKNTRKLSAAESQAALMEEVKSNDYGYRINEHDFSDGFGIYMNPKYELKVGKIMGDTGYISAPNGTEVAITELDNSISLNEHRKNLLIESGYRAVYNYSKEPIFDYGIPVTLGEGINNFKNTAMYTAWRYNDESLNDYGGQLFCDTTMESKFGSGYYIELYNATSGLYYGYYLVEHNGRIFKATGMSNYRDTLLDITLATIDTCVYPY